MRCSKPALSPQFLRFEPGSESNWGLEPDGSAGLKHVTGSTDSEAFYNETSVYPLGDSGLAIGGVKREWSGSWPAQLLR
ncbi:hypothetical protein GW17_00042962 [Ensete ventricosum]|nr:hypothetical protein GW17_00042962 [Ensete ventricosum]RZR91290.1 hypothetical protein BHM03_00019386 [Ensete ventricosum]